MIKSKGKLSIICLTIVVAVGVCVYAFKDSINSNNSYEVYSPVNQDIKEEIDETGEVFSKRVMTVYDNLSQKVKKLNVNIGDSVKKGDVLLEYDNTYDLQISQLNAQLERISANYNEIAKGADFESLSNLKLTINTINNNLEYANDNYERLKKMYDESIITKQELDKAKLEIESLQNQLESANNNYSLLSKGISNNIKKQYDAQTEEVLLSIKLLEKAKENCFVKAEFDGVVTELNVSEGSMTNIRDVVIEVSDMNNMCIHIDLLADEALKVKENMEVVCVDSDENVIISGLKIDKIYPKAFSKISDLGVEQKRIRTEVNLNEKMDNIKLGMELDVKIILNKINSAVTIDKNDVFELDGKKYVTVLRDNKKIDVEVKTGIENGELIEILSGLQKTDEIVK